MLASRILFLGPPGTYTHQAALQQFGNDPSIEYIPTSSIPQCFDELETNKNIQYSVVPLENSTNGQVVFSYDLLRDRMLNAEKNKETNRVIPTLQVIGEQYVAITHCLLSHKKLNKLDDLFDYKTIKIYSHPQVWGQVAQYINNLKEKYNTSKFEIIDTSSTSDAVVQSKEEQEKLKYTNKECIHLAIASETASHIYKVNILDHSINDRLGNTTRFLILERTSGEEQQQQATHKKHETKVSLLTFTTEQDEPGSLVDVLNILKEHQVNMSSIHSRPYNDKENPRKWQYIFYVEYTLDRSKTDWNLFYDQISGKCLQWCLWGTFPRNERYYH